MTRKDYKLIASIIQLLPRHPTQWQVIEAFSQGLKAKDQRFNLEKFQKAAGEGL